MIVTRCISQRPVRGLVPARRQMSCGLGDAGPAVDLFWGEVAANKVGMLRFNGGRVGEGLQTSGGGQLHAGPLGSGIGVPYHPSKLAVSSRHRAHFTPIVHAHISDNSSF